MRQYSYIVPIFLVSLFSFGVIFAEDIPVIGNTGTVDSGTIIVDTGSSYIGTGVITGSGDLSGTGTPTETGTTNTGVVSSGSTGELVVIATPSVPSLLGAMDTIIYLSPTIHSIPGYGNWNDPASWSEGRIPTADDIVEINGTMNIGINPTIKGLIISSAGKLGGWSSYITVNGDVTNNGEITSQAIIIHGNIENNGIWTVNGTTVYSYSEYDSGATINATTPIGGGLAVATTVYLPRTLTVNGTLAFNDSYGISQTINIAPGQGMNINGGMAGIGNIVGVETFINLIGGMTNLVVTGSLTNLNILGDSRVYANTSSLSFKNITLLPGANLYSGFSNLSFSVSAEKLLVSSGANFGSFPVVTITTPIIINDGNLSGGNVVIHGNIENNGIWTVNGTTVYSYSEYDSGATINATTPIGGGLAVATTVYLPRTLTVNGTLAFNDSYGISQTINIAPGQGMNINGGMAGIGNIVGVETFINLIGGMTNLVVTGSLTNLNILGDSRVYANTSSLSFKNITLLPGANLYSGFSNLSFSVSAEKLLVSSGANFGSFPGVSLNSSIINYGTVSGNIYMYGDIWNQGIWGAYTTMYWSPTPGATYYTIRFDPGSSTGFTTSATAYNITDKITGSYYWQVTPNNGSPYERKCINIIGCITWGNAVPTLSLLSSIPTASATGVTISGSIVLNFSKPLDQMTVPGNIILKKTNGDIVSTTALSYSGNSIVFHATSPLDNNTSYTVELKTGLKDTSGNTLELPTSFSFTTVTAFPVPTGLSQQIQSPGLDIQPIRPGEKIGKYQSGSGIILNANVNTSESSRLVVDVYTIGENTPKEFYSEYSTNRIKEKTIPYLDLGVGSYRWKARVETEAGAMSDWVDFGTDNPAEIDYILYEGFEPYPYGYQFVNSSPAYYNCLTDSINCISPGNLLNGGVVGGTSIPYMPRIKVNGNKWEIFELAFKTDWSGLGSSKMLDAFESFGLNDYSTAFQGGNCYGMAVSSAMQYTHSGLLQQYFPNFSTKIGAGTIWDKIDILHINSNKQWDVYDDTVKTILAFQLMQYDTNQNEKRLNYTEALNAYDTLEKNPSITYILNFWGTKEGGFFTKDITVGHTVVPYKVESLPEGKRIYFWDSNVTYPKNKANDELAYNQYIELYNNGKWKAPYYKDWKSFDKISLVSLDDIYNGGEKSAPIGFNGTDMLATLNGESDLIISDTEGRVSGFSGGTIIEEIPGIQVILPLNATLSGASDNTWKQIYIPQKKEGLTFKVSGKTGEQYDLMVAGGDYYSKVAGVTTSTGQVDTYTIAREKVAIDFDDAKTGTYALLIDNFQDTLTGTVYLDNIRTYTGTEQYVVSWTGVVSGASSAVQYSVDYNSDGTNDLTLGLPAVYRDITAPTTTHTLSGELFTGTTSTYMDSLVLSLTSVDNPSGVGVGIIYYALGTDTGSLVYLPYTAPIVVNGVGTYTLHYYAVDKFGNQESDISTVFTLIERPETYRGNISGYVYDDANQNGVRDSGEKGMAGWKICIDTNNNNSCEENTEVFNISNNDGYYEFDSLKIGVYSIQEVPHQNWIVTQPTTTRRIINLLNGQRLQNQNFGNFKVKGGKK